MPVASPTTLVELLESAVPQQPALIIPQSGARLGYRQLAEEVERVASQLAGAGVQPGIRVAMALSNGPAAIVCLLAAAAVGTAAPLNPAYRHDEFLFYLEDTGASLLLVPPTGADEAVRAAAERNIRTVTVAADEHGQVTLAGLPASASPASPNANSIALVLHTSGSTGRPKRVPLSHGRLAISARNIALTYSLTPDDATLCVMPLFHVHGIVASTLATLLTGGAVVLPERFHPLAFWRTAGEHRVSWYSAVPTMHRMLLARAGGGRPPAAGGLRFIRSASAHLTPQTMHRMEEVFGVPVLEAYGMTEAAHQIASNPPPPGERKPGSVGPGTGVRIAIRAPDGRLIGPGHAGEVVIQGPSVISGYEGDASADASAFAEGWFRTGDQGKLDADGYLHLIGRIKDLINRGGEKISPVEIGALLRAHPAIEDAIAFGVPHPTWGEEVAAAVVLRNPVAEAELDAYCREHLADFKCPKKFHVVSTIPRTATGKIKRRAVMEAVLGNEASPHNNHQNSPKLRY
ncbi:MAG: AMP-binding protein [Acidobacteria bacterium]|nr:AMP-binding protein [Acidobacteriota bacterium]